MSDGSRLSTASTPSGSVAASINWPSYSYQKEHVKQVLDPDSFIDLPAELKSRIITLMPDNIKEKIIKVEVSARHGNKNNIDLSDEWQEFTIPVDTVLLAMEGHYLAKKLLFDRIHDQLFSYSDSTVLDFTFHYSNWSKKAIEIKGQLIKANNNEQLIITDIDHLINNVLVHLKLKEYNVIEDMVNYLDSRPPHVTDRLFVTYLLIKKRPTKEQLAPLKPFITSSLFNSGKIPGDEYALIKYLAGKC